MEANYAHQQELDMIPLMMQQDYKPQGWLGLILGTRMWYAMWSADQDDDAAFESRVDAVLREVGDRGRRLLSEAVPPSEPASTPTPAPAPTPTPPRSSVVKSAPAPAPAPAPASASSHVPAPAPRAQPTAAPHQLAATPDHSFSPGLSQSSLSPAPAPLPVTVQQTHAHAQAQGGSSSSSSGGGGGGMMMDVSAFLDLADR
jgi:hypothetical protein